MMNEKGDHKIKSIEKCTRRDDLPNQKEEIDKDKNSCEREVFGPIVHTLEGVKQVRLK